MKIIYPNSVFYNYNFYLSVCIYILVSLYTIFLFNYTSHTF